MKNISEDFSKYALSRGISSLKQHNFKKLSNGYISPTIIEERQLNVAAMDVYSRLFMDRILFIPGEIYDDVSNILVAQLLYLDSSDPTKDISIYINSPGGSVYDGMAIYDTMQFIPSEISTIVTGMAASMAYVLAISGNKGKRYALKHSRLMQHQPLGGAYGQATDIEISMREINKVKNELYDIISTHTGHPKDKIYADCERDYWMTAQEAFEYGAIDEVIIKKNA